MLHQATHSYTGLLETTQGYIRLYTRLLGATCYYTKLHQATQSCKGYIRLHMVALHKLHRVTWGYTHGYTLGYMRLHETMQGYTKLH